MAAVPFFDLSGLSEALSRIEHAISWNDADQQIDEYGESLVEQTVELES